MQVKIKTNNVYGLAACFNDRCLSRRQCLRWQIGMDRNPDRIAGDFAPSAHASKCRFFRKGGEL